MARDIKSYDVFQAAHQTVLKIYMLTKAFPSEERFGLVSQMRRSAYSIPMNLVEGASRRTQSDFAHFVNIANGSCQEIKYQLELVRDLGYISVGQFEEFIAEYIRISKMLFKLESILRNQSR
jgi:four helix bundle protein